MSAVMVLGVSVRVLIVLFCAEANVRGADRAWRDDREGQAEDCRAQRSPSWHHRQEVEVRDVHGEHGRVPWALWAPGAGEADVSYRVHEDRVEHHALRLLQLLQNTRG